MFYCLLSLSLFKLLLFELLSFSNLSIWLNYLISFCIFSMWRVNVRKIWFDLSFYRASFQLSGISRLFGDLSYEQTQKDVLVPQPLVSAAAAAGAAAGAAGSGGGPTGGHPGGGCQRQGAASWGSTPAGRPPLTSATGAGDKEERDEDINERKTCCCLERKISA